MAPKKNPKREKEHNDNASASDSEGDAPVAKRARTEGGSSLKRKMTVKEAKLAKLQDEAEKFFKDCKDPMKMDVTEHYVTVDQLFAKCTKTTDYLHNDRRNNWNWSVIKGRLMSRKADDDTTWYLQNRTDSLMKGRFGTDGINVDNFVIASFAQKTLAPSHFILKDHRSAADIEDNAPERVMSLASQGVKWFPITKDQEGKEGTNAYILLRESEVKVWTAAAVQAGGSGAAVASLEKTPSMFGFGGPSASSVTDNKPAAAPPAEPTSATKGSNEGFGFGFGAGTGAASVSSAPALSNQPSFGFAPGPANNNAAPAAAPAPSFGFGTGPSTPAVTADNNTGAKPSFGFGGAASPPSAPSPSTGGGNAPAAPIPFGQNVATPAAPAAPAAAAASPTRDSSNATETAMARAMTTFGQGNQEKQLKVNDILWVVWSEKKIKDIRAEHKAGTKIMKKGFPVPAVSPDCKVKLVMESDVKDKPSKAADKVVESYFVKNDETLQEIITAINDFPSDQEKTVELLGAIKTNEIKEAKKDNEEYDELYAKMHPVLTKELENLVDVRKQEIGKEAELVDEADNLYKAMKIAPRSAVKILKFYPENECEFRTWGRVSGLLEEGEQAECYPEPFKLEVASSFRKAD